MCRHWGQIVLLTERYLNAYGVIFYRFIVIISRLAHKNRNNLCILIGFLDISLLFLNLLKVTRESYDKCQKCQ